MIWKPCFSVIFHDFCVYCRISIVSDFAWKWQNHGRSDFSCFLVILTSEIWHEHRVHIPDMACTHRKIMNFAFQGKSRKNMHFSWFFHDFSWFFMIFVIFDDFSWFFDEKSYDKCDVSDFVIFEKSKISKIMIFDEKTVILHEKSWFLRDFWWFLMIFDDFWRDFWQNVMISDRHAVLHTRLQRLCHSGKMNSLKIMKKHEKSRKITVFSRFFVFFRVFRVFRIFHEKCNYA